MTEPEQAETSTPRRIVKYSEQWWETRSETVLARRCKAHLSDGSGERCRRVACDGQRVCPTHGGSAVRAKAAARRRLDEAADRMAAALLGIAESAESEPVRLAAIRDALSRAGVSEKQAVEVEVSAAPWQDIAANSIVSIERMTRAESRARRGLAEPQHALPAADPNEPIDAEVIDPHQPAPNEAHSEPPWVAHARTDAERARPASGLMSMEDAVTQLSADGSQPRPKRVRSDRF